jgi:hypothetical protein
MLVRGSYNIILFNSFNKFSIKLTLIQYPLFLQLFPKKEEKKSVNKLFWRKSKWLFSIFTKSCIRSSRITWRYTLGRELWCVQNMQYVWTKRHKTDLYQTVICKTMQNIHTNLFWNIYWDLAPNGGIGGQNSIQSNLSTKANQGR